MSVKTSGATEPHVSRWQSLNPLRKRPKTEPEEKTPPRSTKARPTPQPPAKSTLTDSIPYRSITPRSGNEKVNQVSRQITPRSSVSVSDAPGSAKGPLLIDGTYVSREVREYIMSKGYDINDLDAIPGADKVPVAKVAQYNNTSFVAPLFLDSEFRDIAIVSLSGGKEIADFRKSAIVRDFNKNNENCAQIIREKRLACLVIENGDVKGFFVHPFWAQKAELANAKQLVINKSDGDYMYPEKNPSFSPMDEGSYSRMQEAYLK